MIQAPKSSEYEQRLVNTYFTNHEGIAKLKFASLRV